MKSVARILGKGLPIAVAIALFVFAMRTTRPPVGWDRDAWRIFDGATLWILSSIALGVVLVRYRAKLSPLLARVPRVAIDLAFFAIAFFVTWRTTIKAFGAWPQIQDEIAYDLLARRIASGHPVPDSHPLFEFFRIRFLVDDGRNYVLFQPGWPLLIAFFRKLGAPSLAPAFAVASLVAASSRLADRLYGRVTSIVAGVLLLGCAFLQIVGAAFFAHAWAAALLVIALERLVAALEEEDRRRATIAAVLAGLAGAWLVLTRLPTAPTLALAALAAAVAYGVEWRRVEGSRVPRPKLRARAKRPLLVFAIALSLGPLAQAGWNLATTRHALELPQDRYFAQTEPKPHCHGLGFGPEIGCPREHPLDTFPQGYTFDRALTVSWMRWQVFRIDAWGTAWPIALAGLFFLRRMRLRDLVPLAGTLGPIAVYFGFYYHAIQHGARLWADLLGPLAIVIAAGAAAAFDDREVEGGPGRARAIASAACIGVLVLVVGDVFERDLPERIARIAKTRQAERVRNNLDAANVHDAVVYLGNCIDPDRGDVVLGWASVLGATPPESGDRLIVRDFGPEHDRQMATLYPKRRHVRADCNGHPVAWDFVQPDPKWIVTELESKFPPDERAGCYASFKAWPGASYKAVLEIKADQPGAWAAFRQHVFEPGDYQVSLSFVRRPDGGRFTLAIDGQVLEPPIDTRGMPIAIERWTASAPRSLGAGMHRIEVRSLETTGTHYFALDRLELKKP